jgi:hypothetical protein
MKKSQLVSALIFNTIILLVISKLATKSLNPVEIFRGDSIFLKIVAGFLCMTLLSSLIGFVFAGSFGDKSCGKCGKNLVQYAGALGKPMLCNYCKRWFHELCIKQEGGSTFGGCKQSDCVSGQNQFGM